MNIHKQIILVFLRRIQQLLLFLFLMETQIRRSADSIYLYNPGYVFQKCFFAKTWMCLFVRVNVVTFGTWILAARAESTCASVGPIQESCRQVVCLNTSAKQWIKRRSRSLPMNWCFWAILTLIIRPGWDLPKLTTWAALPTHRLTQLVLPPSEYQMLQVKSPHCETYC